jgi:hypothetical protein
MEHKIESKGLLHLEMPLQSATLVIEAKEAALMDGDEKHNQSPVLIDKGMSMVGMDTAMLPKAAGQGKQHPVFYASQLHW